MGKRWKLFFAAVACFGFLFFIVLYFSVPIMEIVASLPEIEVIWEIEDTKTLSEEPILKELYRDGKPLPKDQTGTFYCSLGLSMGDEWPELYFSLPKGYSACFADDYLWDACCDAIAQGNRYRILIWTDEVYSYQDIVFTGLPVVCLTCNVEAEEILIEDVPVELLFSAPDKVLISHARIHRRGGSSFHANIEKRGYRVELTRNTDGSRKVRQDLPVFGEADTFVLLPLAEDQMKLRERMAWELWNNMCGDVKPFGRRIVFYCEVLLNGDYRGVYLAMQPYDVETELSATDMAAGSAVYRTSVSQFLRGRPAVQHPKIPTGSYRVYFSPESNPESGIEPYIRLINEEDDEAFKILFSKLADTESLLRYDLFVQACALADNIFNNMYICILHENGGISIHVAPWDLDLSFGRRPEEIGQNYEYWIWYPLFDRALLLDCEHLRARLTEQWQEYRQNIFSEENITKLAEGFAEELNRSGAMVRDAERWELDQYISEYQNILDYWFIRMTVLDEAIAQISEGDVNFLTFSQYHEKGGPIWISKDEMEESL